MPRKSKVHLETYIIDRQQFGKFHFKKSSLLKFVLKLFAKTSFLTLDDETEDLMSASRLKTFAISKPKEDVKDSAFR